VCLWGASATESLLEKIHDPDLNVLVVWEPILPTDWERPTTSVLARIHNSGVEQFWDHNHLIAHAISRELASDSSGPRPHCCMSSGNLWDFAALYQKGAVWHNSPPKAVFADGPVVHIQPGLRTELGTLMGHWE
jgi:hypothetical protein